jgi:hypothetical protein
VPFIGNEDADVCFSTEHYAGMSHSSESKTCLQANASMRILMAENNKGGHVVIGVIQQSIQTIPVSNTR